jgi:hypothetical protein
MSGKIEVQETDPVLQITGTVRQFNDLYHYIIFFEQLIFPTSNSTK